MIEFAIVGPILTVIGLSLIQYGMLFFAKNQINHGAFIAARAGSVSNANLDKVQEAYAQALVPMYGGGKDVGEVAQTLVKAKADIAANTRIELLNPTRQSFDDWNDPVLQTALTNGARRVISNRNLAYKDRTIGASSGQTIQDANLIKLRITHGYRPIVPLVASITKAYLKWQDTGGDAFHTRMVEAGRIPVVTHVTLQMQSDAFEPDNPVSAPGAGNGGNPGDPGDPPVTSSAPPDCRQGGCSTTSPAPTTGGDSGPGSTGAGGTCPAPIRSVLSADTLFAFDSATLPVAGSPQLDELIAKAKAQSTVFSSLTVTGHTDPIGSDAYNKDLSQRRADAVSNYLNSKGIKANEVKVVGAGATDLVAPQEQCSGKTGDELKKCYAPNRRVVVDLKP